MFIYSYINILYILMFLVNVVCDLFTIGNPAYVCSKGFEGFAMSQI